MRRKYRDSIFSDFRREGLRGLLKVWGHHGLEFGNFASHFWEPWGGGGGPSLGIRRGIRGSGRRSRMEGGDFRIKP